MRHYPFKRSVAVIGKEDENWKSVVKMLSAKLKGKGIVHVEKVPAPQPKDDKLLIKVKSVCI